jgi:hypothetical protein
MGTIQESFNVFDVALPFEVLTDGNSRIWKMAIYPEK